MVFFLGIIDLIAALLLVTKGISSIVLIIFAILLFFKALICLTDIGGWLDIGAGILLILKISIIVPPLLILIVAGFLALKGVMSLFAR
jgi:hypothetical protein